MITIYRNQTELFSTEINKDSKLSRQLMSDDYITLKFSLLEPIKFELGDFCDCDFGRYELITPYNPSYNSTTGGYDYELRLDAEYRKWKNKIFQYRPQYGGLEASWSLTETIDVFMQVFLSNLTAHGYKYKRETEYHVEYSDDVDLTEAHVLSFSDTNMIDALSQIAEEWETEWWIDNNIIHIGKCQIGTEENALDFEDGVNVTAMSSSASSSDYLTRLYVFGSTTNVPSRYRKKLVFDVKSTGDNVIYDTARPLSLDMFKSLSSAPVAKLEFGADNIEGGIGVDVAFDTKSAVTFTDKGTYTIYADTAEISIDIVDPYETWEKFFEEDKHRIFGFCFNCNIYITVKATQGESIVGSATNSYTVETSYLRYNKQNIGAFKLPELKINDYKLEDIKITVTVRVGIEGSMLLQFESGVIYDGEDGTTAFNIGATVEQFKFKAAISKSEVDIFRQSAQFPIKVTSGTETGSTDTGTYYEGSEVIYLSALSLTLGDKYAITDNIILPKVPAYYFTDTYQSEIVKTSVVERHLMLPLSWNNGHNWIDAEEDLSEEEVVEGVLVLDDIYPKAKCTVTKVLAYKIEIVDEETQKKTGQYNTYYLVATDDMTLKKDYLLSTASNFEISFNTGSLNGMKFEFDLKEKGYVFENVVQDDGTLASQTLDRQYFHIYASEDYGRLLPDTILAPNVGDEFYVLNYDASYFDDMGLTSAAEAELLEEGKEYMEKNKIDPNTYSCPLYWWYAEEKGILPLGQRVNLVSNAYFKTGKRASRIRGIECCLDIPYDTPIYTVGEDVTYSRLGNIEDKLDEIVLNGKTYIGKGGSSSGSSVYLIKRDDTTPASDTNAYSSKRSDYNYPSKQSADTFKGLMTFLQGIVVSSGYGISQVGQAILSRLKIGDYSIADNGDAILRDIVGQELASSDYDAATQTGYGMKRKSDGKYKLSLTDLEVWGRAVFHELEIRKLSYAGGNFLFSPAGSTVFAVEKVYTSGTLTGYKCYYLADNGSTATENLWKENDLAFSESFNIEEGTYTDVANKRYWRKVTVVSTENVTIDDADGNALYDGQKFGWVLLSATDCEDGSDEPAAGDIICCLGNSSDTSRQNAIAINTNGDANIDAPALIQYAKITTYTLTGKDVTVISPSGNKFTGDFTTNAGRNVDDTFDDIDTSFSLLNTALSDAVKKINADIASVRTTAEEAKSGVTEVKGTVSTLTNTVSGIQATVGMLSDTVDEQGNQIGELETSVTQIDQKADSISLKVDRQSVRGRNLIPLSYFFLTSKAYGAATRTFKLETGKKYSLSVNGHIDTALLSGGGVLRIYLYNASWSWMKYADIKSTDDTTVKLESDNSFTVPSTGDYYFTAYAFHDGNTDSVKAQEDGTFTLNWAQLEEGEVCTPWSLHESDPAIQGNLLPSLGDTAWTRLSNITTEGLEVGGVKIPNVHYANTASSEKDVLLLQGGYTFSANASYTLSFWVRGTGTIKSFVYPDACEYAEDNTGQNTTSADGYLSRTITSVWQRVRIRFSTGQLFPNVLYNADFSGGGSTTWSDAWDYTGTVTRPTRVKCDGYYTAYVQKTAATDAYCEISQGISASVAAGWWTLSFKVKSTVATRVILLGIAFTNIDNSGNTVCVDGVNKALSPDGSGAAYIDFGAASDFTEHVITFKAGSVEATARLYFRSLEGDFYIAKPMLTNGMRASGFCTRENGQVKSILPCRLSAGGEVWIGGVKMEQGGIMTDYSEQTVQELLATGIDILNRKIVVTADQFTIQNNQGEQTFSVNAEGQVTMNHIALGGTINKQAVDVTAATFANLFNTWQDNFAVINYGTPKISNLYGIYYFTEAIGQTTVTGAIRLHMPSAYVDSDGYFCGDVYDDDGNLSETVLRSVRALVGNTILIYNDSSEDIDIEGVSPYFEDDWQTSSTAKTATVGVSDATEESSDENAVSVASVTATTSPSNGGAASDATSGFERPSTSGSVNPNQQYKGRKRDDMRVTLKGGSHQFVSLSCVCEVGKYGWENIYWLVNYGQGLNT